MLTLGVTRSFGAFGVHGLFGVISLLRVLGVLFGVPLGVACFGVSC